MLSLVNLFSMLASYNSYSSGAADEAAAALAGLSVVGMSVFMIIIIGVFVLIIFALIAVILLSNWFLFQKADMPGWYAIIPFYNSFMLSKMVFGSPWYGLIFLAPMAFLPLELIPYLGFVVSMVVNVVMMAFNILMCIRLAKCFGGEVGMMFLLILVPIVGYPILAFKKEYQYIPSEAKFL